MKTVIPTIVIGLMLGSFALRAQDDVSDEQIRQEMTEYLTHLNGEGDHAKKQEKQLEFLEPIKDFWKIPEFRKLRAISLEEILKDHTQDPYFLTAIAFHNEDLEKIATDLNQLFIQNALQFRKQLREYDPDAYAPLYALKVDRIPDILKFSPKSTYLITSSKIERDPNPVFSYLTDNIILWSLKSLNPSPASNDPPLHFLLLGEPPSFAFSSDEQKFAIGDQSGNVEIFQYTADGGKKRVCFSETDDHGFIPIGHINLDPTEPPTPVTSLAFGHKNDRLYVGRDNEKIRSYDGDKLVNEYKTDPHSKIYEMSLSQDDEYLYYEGGLGKPFLLSLNDGTHIKDSNLIQTRMEERFLTSDTTHDFLQNVFQGIPLWTHEFYASNSGFRASIAHASFHPTEPWLFFIKQAELYRQHLDSKEAELIPTADSNSCAIQTFTMNRDGNLFAIAQLCNDVAGAEVVIYQRQTAKLPDLKLLLLVPLKGDSHHD